MQWRNFKFWLWKKIHPAEWKKIREGRREIEAALKEVFPPTEGFSSHLGDAYQLVQNREISRAREFGQAWRGGFKCPECGNMCITSPKQKGMWACRPCNLGFLSKETWNNPQVQSELVHNNGGKTPEGVWLNSVGEELPDISDMA